MKPKAKHPDIDWIFFDVGGVIVDNITYEEWRTRGVMEAVKPFIPIDHETYAKARKPASAKPGNLSHNVIAELLSNEEHRQKAHAAHEEWKKREPHDYVKDSIIREDCLVVARELSHHYRLGIIANQPSSMQRKLNEAGLLQYFDHVGLSEDHGFEKPDKRLFHIIFEQTQANPRRSLMIDDNIDRGLLPAHELGMQTCWFRVPGDERPSWVNFQIEALSDLLKFF